MTIELERKHYTIFASIAVLLVAGTILFYYLSYVPKKVKTEQIAQDIQIEEQLIQVLEQQADVHSDLVNTVELQRKIPVAPFMEQLILEMEKAEVMSGSTILNMTFREDAFTATVQDENGNAKTPGGGAGESSIPNVPEGLKSINVNMSIQAEKYEDLTNFLESIEKLTRITQIQSVAFKGQPEITSITQELDPITYTVQLTAFYHSGLENIIEELPPIDAPEPSNKNNPFIDNE